MAEPNMLIPLPDEMARLMKLTQWQAEQIERLRARVFALEDAQGGDAIPLAEPRTPEAQRTAEICLSEWATARMEAMEAAIGALQREAYTWSKAAETYAADADRFRWLAERTAATGLARWVHPFQFLAEAVDARKKAEAASAAPRVTTAAELRQQAKSDTSCVGAFARARPGKA